MARGPKKDDPSVMLLEAVMTGNLTRARIALRIGGRLDGPRTPASPLGPLMAAVTLGDAKMVDLFLEAGALVNAEGEGGSTALYQAAVTDGPEVAQRLIDAGANVSAITSRKDTPLHYFAERGHLTGARVLLDAGAEVDPLNKFGDTPLIKAVRKRHASTAAVLLEAGANQAWRDDQGYQAIHTASGAGDLDSVDVLVQANGAIVNSIINSAEDYGQTPLHVAASNGRAAVAGFLMRAGARLSHGYYRRTALHEAMTNKSAAKVASEILTFLREQDDGTRALGAALAQRDNDGITPLHAACLFGNLRAVDMFMQHGVVEIHRDNAGRTPAVRGQEYWRNGAPNVAGGKGKSETDASKREKKAKAILRSLARGPAFRARSFLWPRDVVEEDRGAVKAVVESRDMVKGKDRRPWTVHPIRTRRSGQKKKPFSFAAAVSRYANKS